MYEYLLLLQWPAGNSSSPSRYLVLHDTTNGLQLCLQRRSKSEFINNINKHENLIYIAPVLPH